MNVLTDCERTPEGRIAVEAAVKAAAELREPSVIAGLPDEVYSRDVLLPYIYQAVLEAAMKRELDRKEHDRMKEEWWKMQGIISTRKVHRFMDDHYGQPP